MRMVLMKYLLNDCLLKRYALKKYLPKKYLLVVVCLLSQLFFVEAFATKVYLLTMSPSQQEVYTMWGHTALRVHTDSVDKVYNYGVFLFDDGFLYKFVKGETDYWLDTETIMDANYEAMYKNVYLYQQTLNLTEEEAQAIYQALEENLKPENRVYRYNFFYDNCATRPRNIVEKVLGEIRYPEINNKKTYRDEIYKLTKSSPWLTFGIDLCLGVPTDERIPDYDLMFLPMELHRAYEGAERKVDGVWKPLIRKEITIVQPVHKKGPKEHCYFTPMLCFSLLFLAFAVWTLVRVNRQKQQGKQPLIVEYVLDDVLFIAYGLLGIILAFLAFVSIHPCTHPNLNLLWSNPLQLLFPILVCWKQLTKPFCILLIINAIACIITIFGYWLFPQTMNVATLPLAALMAMRSLYWVWQRGGVEILGFKTSKKNV